MRPNRIVHALCAAVFCIRPVLGAARYEILRRDAPSPQLPQERGSNSSALATATTSSSSVDQHSSSSTIETSSSMSASQSVNTTTTSSTSEISFILYTPPSTTITPTDAGNSSCIDKATVSTVTSYSIIYTSTTTFYGNSTDYTPPFPTISTTPYCKTTRTKKPWKQSTNVPVPSGSTATGLPLTSHIPTTMVFVTTEKNPSPVFSPSPPPDFSGPRIRTKNPGSHATASATSQHKGGNGDGGDSKDGGNGDHGDKPRPTATKSVRPVTVTAGSDFVIIGSSTIKGIQPGKTSTVVVDGNSYTVFPTAVVGDGVTIKKPIPVAPTDPTTDASPSPIVTNIGGLPLSISGSVLEVDGRTLTIPTEGTSTIINGQLVSIAPGTAVVDQSETLTWPNVAIKSIQPDQTSVIVAGGEMMTAIGQTIFVFNSTTLTYGPTFQETLTTVDDDIITIGSEGIKVNGITVGGLSAGIHETTKEIVGGATISRIGKSVYVINDKTYTLSDGFDAITTTIGGEVLTIGPKDVVAGSVTVDPSDDGVVVATIQHTKTSTNDVPKETSTSQDDEDDDEQPKEGEEDAAGAIRPNIVLSGLCAAVALLAFSIGHY